MPCRTRTLAIVCTVLFATGASGGSPGYYRQPTLHGNTLIFVAEGDLWKAPLAGGVATRLTSHLGDESYPAFSPDGQTLGFCAQYEGPTEVYTMPVSGGVPARRTFAGKVSALSGWTPDGRLLYATDVHSTLPNWQLFTLGLTPDSSAVAVPLAQAADGWYDDAGKTLFFTRLRFQGSHTKRYKGGTAQNLWRFADGDAEATPLTADYPGTSKRPMFWQGRVYFASDRDGTMNLWSIKPDGSDAQQHTRHAGWDVAAPWLNQGRIVYQLGADLHVYDIAAGQDRAIPLALDSDFDQMRENWVAKPLDYLTAAHVSPNGDRVVLTARGQVFVAPRRQGRLIEASRQPGVRYRDARFMPDGKSLLVFADPSGEVELWKLPANGVGAAEQLTRDGDVLRWDALPSPDGRYIAHHDKNQRLFLFDTEKQENRKIDESAIDNFADLSWSPDSRWLTYVVNVENMFRVIRLYSVANGSITTATTDRFDSYNPVFSPDGKWLYFLSDRNLATVVGSPWGNYQPEPFLDKKTRIFHLALRADEPRSPFAPADELHSDDAKRDESKGDEAKRDAKDDPEKPTTQETESRPAVETQIDLAGLPERLTEVPVPPGNYSDLSVNDKGLFWRASPTGERKSQLVAAEIKRENVETKTVLDDVRSYEMSADRKKLLVRKGDTFAIIDAAVEEANLDKKEVNLSGWVLSVPPREEWRQMFDEAWRLERDYFYDRGMHGVNWQALREKFRPLVDRVSTRGELADLLAQMVGELSALHIFVYGGELRKGEDDVQPAALGARLGRDAAAGGYRVAHVFQHDPDEPQRASPLARPGVEVNVNDVIVQINGVDTLSVPDPGLLLRNQAGRQVLLRVQPAAGEPRDVIVTPLSAGDASDLRYHEWELTRRRVVEQQSNGQIGYVHLRAMGGGNFTEWAKNFYPVFNRAGLIIDVRHNRGGNIDSWILGRLLRKAWFYWSQRVGQAPSWNMQYAFRGHVVVLCNEFTASDGEAFAEGIKRLKLGTVIGTRTWGGEIWLSSNNFLVDGGIATAAEFGVYGPEGAWLIEGHGVEPDVVVDNLPHATFNGQDAQLEAALAHLQKLIRAQPVEPLLPPKYPDKSN